MFTPPAAQFPWGVHFFRSVRGDTGTPSLALEHEPVEELVMEKLNQKFRLGTKRADTPTTAEITRDGEVVARFCAINEHRVDKMPHLARVPGFKPVSMMCD